MTNPPSSLYSYSEEKSPLLQPEQPPYISAMMGIDRSADAATDPNSYHPQDEFAMLPGAATTDHISDPTGDYDSEMMGLLPTDLTTYITDPITYYQQTEPTPPPTPTPTPKPTGPTSIIIPGMPLDGSPFSHNWAIPEDAGSHNPTLHPLIDPSYNPIPDATWFDLQLRLPLHERLPYKAKRNFMCLPGHTPTSSPWFLSRPDFLVRVRDQDRIDLNALEQSAGGREMLPPPAIEHRRRDWMMSTLTHYGNEMTGVYEPVGWMEERMRRSGRVVESAAGGGGGVLGSGGWGFSDSRRVRREEMKRDFALFALEA